MANNVTSPGITGYNLQAAPVVNGQPQQSYVLGMPTDRRALRPLIVNGPIPGTGTGVPGTPVQYASGNPAVATDDIRRQTAAGPPNYGNNPGNGKQPGNPYGGDPQGKVGPLRFSQETNVRNSLSLNDKLGTADRHAYLKTGYENSGRNSGQTDPPLDGPPRPSLATVNRSITWQEGTVYGKDAVNGNADDLTRDYTRNQQGMFVGEQGSGWSPVYGGVPGLYQPYGSYQGITAGPVKGVQSPVPQGQPGDGPRKVFSGPPHGLHSPTLPDYKQTLGYYMAMPAPRAPRMDRPDNSTAAGQSYSQTVVPQGQTGTVAAQPVKWAGIGSNGWRGQ